MTGEIRMSSADTEMKRQTVHNAHRLAECSRKWRPRQETNDGRLLTDGTAGRADAIPFNTHAMSASLKLTRSGRRNHCTAVSRGRQTRGHSDEVEIPNELRR